MFKLDIVEREEDFYRFKVEIFVLYEKFVQNGNQVQKLYYINEMVMNLIIVVIIRCMIRKYQLFELQNDFNNILIIVFYKIKMIFFS